MQRPRIDAPQKAFAARWCWTVFTNEERVLTDDPCPSNCCCSPLFCRSSSPPLPRHLLLPTVFWPISPLGTCGCEAVGQLKTLTQSELNSNFQLKSSKPSTYSLQCSLRLNSKSFFFMRSSLVNVSSSLSSLGSELIIIRAGRSMFFIMVLSSIFEDSPPCSAFAPSGPLSSLSQQEYGVFGSEIRSKPQSLSAGCSVSRILLSSHLIGSVLVGFEFCFEKRRKNFGQKRERAVVFKKENLKINKNSRRFGRLAFGLFETGARFQDAFLWLLLQVLHVLFEDAGCFCSLISKSCFLVHVVVGYYYRARSSQTSVDFRGCPEESLQKLKS